MNDPYGNDEYFDDDDIIDLSYLDEYFVLDFSVEDFETDTFEDEAYRDDLQIAAQVITDKTPVRVHIEVKDLWLIVVGIQLASRHPEVSVVVKEMWEYLARYFQSMIVEIHPEAESVIEKGWHPEHDVELVQPNDEGGLDQ